jgi:hypothetical protein
MIKEPFLIKNVSITPSDKKRCVIRPFVRGPWIETGERERKKEREERRG